MTNTFNTLPIDVQEEIKDTLKAFDETNVWFENGEYKVLPMTGIKSHYSSDYKVIGVFKANEIFTEEERAINYIESFHDYPVGYTGKRDYKMLKKATWETKFKFDDNGNIVIA